MDDDELVGTGLLELCDLLVDDVRSGDGAAGHHLVQVVCLREVADPGSLEAPAEG